MSRLLVHVGPTLPAAEVHRIAPEAEVHPPVEGGMLGRTQPRAGDVIVLIDGYYRDRPAVRHKEIMHLIDNGVTVVGAASMGALRAAELDSHGMVGIGQIYQMYKAGEIDGDDEVAIKHRTAEYGYRADSIALVNLRFGTQRAVDEGVVSPETAAAVVSAAKGLVFDERTWPQITAAIQGCLSAAGLAEIPALARYCSGRPCDLKALDAVLALAHGQRLLAGPRPAPGDEAADGQPAGPRAVRGGQAPPWRTVYLRQWVRHWDFEITEAGEWICDDDILDAARLYSPGYPDIHQEVLSQLLAELVADGQPDRASASRGAMDLLGLGVGDPLPERFGAMLSAEEARLPTADQASLIVVRTWHTSVSRDWRPFVVAKLKTRPSWGRWRDLVVAADAARNARTEQVPAFVAGLLFLRKWGTSGPAATAELVRRGFLTLTELDGAARRFAALELAGQPGER
jgi:hypothetical protein